MTAPKELNAFESVNKALGEYYQLQDNDTFYDDANPTGRFLAYCEENGFELEDIDEEFENDPSDCIYCDFDENFPIDKSLKIDDKDDEQRINEIFNVIKYCYDNGKPPKYFSTMNITLTTNKDDIKCAEERYTSQCPKIFKSQEETLKEVFAIGLKNDFPFISYLVDAYQRDRMLSKHQDLTAATWAKESPYIKKIHSKSKNQATTIQSGIETYMKRVAPRFHWKAMNKIQDDIKTIIKYFISAGQFVDSLLQQKQATPPFAYDVVIVVKKTVSNSTTVIPDLSDSDDDDDDDDGNDFKMDDGNGGKDYFSNIEDKLKGNDCSFVSKTVKGSNRGARFMMETFKELSNKLNKDKYNKEHEYNMSEYPRKKRFCALIDRRGDDKKSDDSMIMFEPPDDSNSIPDKHVPDWYFNAGKTCIIPSDSYKKGTKSKDYDPQDTIRVDNAYKGQVMTLSFHVDSSVSIRCYLFWNGCYIRIIYPNDLKTILTAIFDTEYKGNKAYINGQQSTDDLKQLKVVDETFDAFYKEVTMSKK